MSLSPPPSSARTDDVGPVDGPPETLRPNPAVFIGGTGVLALLSALTLPWPLAVASTLLGALMVAGADVDARTCLLPDLVTLGAVVAGLLAAYLLEPFDPWAALGEAAARAAILATSLLLVRWSYAWLRGREGLGLGDVKLAGGIGAWLPWDSIPVCFALAAGAGLVCVLLLRLRGGSVNAALKIPLGAFLCPALWLVFYGTVLPT